MSFCTCGLKGDGEIPCAHPPQVFFQRTSSEKVIARFVPHSLQVSFCFPQLRIETKKVMRRSSTGTFCSEGRTAVRPYQQNVRAHPQPNTSDHQQLMANSGFSTSCFLAARSSWLATSSYSVFKYSITAFRSSVLNLSP